MSFLKQEPPKPIEETRNLSPILLSAPTALDTSLMLAPETSHRADRLLIEDTL